MEQEAPWNLWNQTAEIEDEINAAATSPGKEMSNYLFYPGAQSPLDLVENRKVSIALKHLTCCHSRSFELIRT